MRRRNGAAGWTGLLLLGALGLAVGPAAVAGVSVAQACKEVSCFSGVVAACGSCLPAQADAVSGRPALAFDVPATRRACPGKEGNLGVAALQSASRAPLQPPIALSTTF